MASQLNITRRDFLGGMALGVAAGGTLSPLELLAARGAPYPPGLSGMRGSHDGSFEVAHAQARDGKTWPRPANLSDDVYDLVVVGGGISGLSAAFLYRQQAGPNARILVLDNHDDFGGHAKRNEFDIDGKRVIGYGGSMTIDQPATYSKEAAQLLRDIGIDVQKFYDYYDFDFNKRHGLTQGIYFSADAYGANSVHPTVVSPFYGVDLAKADEIIDGYPLSDASRDSLLGLLTDKRDYLPGKSRDEKIAYMRGISYSDYLRRHCDAPEEVVVLLRDTIKGLWGFGWDALSALEGARYGMPGTAHLGPENLPNGVWEDNEPYIHHFPDGNAGVARALVRRLIPAAVPGDDSMPGLVASRVDYSLLDRRSNATRIRLNSTATDIRHADNGNAVDVTYVCNVAVHRVRGKHVIAACYNHSLPIICPELPAEQAEAIAVATKVPLVYINVALRNWHAFKELGYNGFYIPQPELMHSFVLDFPISMGDYRFADDPSDPIVIHGTFCPTAPDQGLTERQQHVVGRARMLTMSFADYEDAIVRQVSGALEGGGFDAERDIAAITVNRWPHGYAYEYNELYDPHDWGPTNGPHLIGRRPFGRISIANSDASAYAYVNGAIDAAVRAVAEQLS